MASSSSVPWVYILRCSDNSFYVGTTSDLEFREQWHNDGHGSNYTAKRRPVRIVYCQQPRTLLAARRRERQIKRWSVAKKQALIAGDYNTLKRLSRRRVDQS